ncbi:MAG: DUF6398 domain-containing protein [Candidatus Omnitrophota bacterium]
MELKSTKTEKTIRLDEIKELLISFFAKNLNEDYLRYSLNLCDRIKEQKSLSMNRGKKEVWAAAIVFVIARLNFLFDKDNDNYINSNAICDFFGTKKSTTGNKASEIAAACDLVYGEEGLSDPRINKQFSFVYLENGMIVPKELIGDKEIVLNIVTEKEAEEIDRCMEERRRLRKEKEREKKERRAEINRKIAEEEKKQKECDQPNLFDDL